MCGILGFVGNGDQRDVKNMLASLRHRGPDDEGVFFEHPVGLGHARLSILDTSPAGHQPMFSQDRTVCIVFNGEIYNFQTLRQELENKGYHFKSSSDTEVIITLYQTFGENCFEKLNGMFAIGLYDFREKKLILVRDRLGEKPLYWSVFNNTLIFGSELKALVQHPSFQKRLDLTSVNQYLLSDYIPTPKTIFQDVYKLEPASMLIYQHGQIRKKTFWEPTFDSRQLSFREALMSLDKKLDESVKTRLVSDVPLGIFLSGGLDSSTVAYYAQKHSAQTIKTFSMGFTETSFDESTYAQTIAHHLGTDHYSERVTAHDALQVIPHIADILDEPMADPSIIPTYLLSRFTRKHVTVALGGDGGDELFAGYPTFQADVFANLYQYLPTSIRKILSNQLLPKLPVSDKNFSLGFKLKKFLQGASDEPAQRHQQWLGTFGRDQRQALFLPDIWENLKAENEFAVGEDYFHTAKTSDPRHKILAMYLRTYLMDQVLVKVDRASMKNSLEVRAPFLDHELVDFVYSLPYSFKQKGLTTKYILKKLMEERLPSSVVHRSKKGFGIPLSGWLKGELGVFCDETLSRDKIHSQALFNYEYIAKLKDDHFGGRGTYQKELWSLIVFTLWHDTWLSNTL